MNCYHNNISTLNLKSIEIIKKEYLKDKRPWALGFSGGKDSTALLILLFLALNDIDKKHKPLYVIYCDTGIMIPTINKYVRETLTDISIEAQNKNIPIITKIVTPQLEDRYFPKIIGRGYPPPTNKFRWCTDVLRINPIKKFLNNIQKQGVILLGIRKGESFERNKIILKYQTNDEYILNKQIIRKQLFSAQL